MKVIKFGGTSVGSVEGLRSVQHIIQSQKSPVIIVVSALGGVTDMLLATARQAAQGDAAYQISYDALCTRHFDLIAHLLPQGPTNEALCTKIATYLDELRRIYQGLYLIRDLSTKTSDTIVSYGELLSSHIVTELLGEAILCDARTFIKTERKYGKHLLDASLTQQGIHLALGQVRQNTVVPGFVATDRDTGDITNLGRGGSDYTAALIAAALDAEVLEIWSDVDGFMTADPKIISTAYPIKELSYGEAMELCNFGAKVIYPPTIYPVCHKQIPIWVKNTFNPTATGTRIQGEVSQGDTQIIKGISSIKDACLITVQGLGMVGVIGVNYRIFKALSKHNISVFLVAQAASENNTSIGVKCQDVALACRALNSEFAAEIAQGEIHPMQVIDHLATVAIVGDAMKHSTGIAGKLFGTLGRNGINVIACAQGASETNISFVIDEAQLRKALNVIHDSFFLSPYQVLNLFVCGIGTVGGSLLSQIQQQQDNLKEKKGLKLNVVGIANSKCALYDKHGIDLSTYATQLQTQGIPTTAASFKEQIIDLNIFNSVFVDCTASAAVAAVYQDLLEHSVSVVAANKIAASSDYNTYKGLKTVCKKHDVKFLYEANVGAGLPIINTIDNLINSGDRILKIEAVLSGTLNFVFNTLSADIPFSKAIRLAQEAQYAEPDPRIDLSGADVVRKLVILTREAGYPIEQSDVQRHPFLPDELFAGTLEDFWQRLPQVDAHFEAQRQRLQATGSRLRFVARYDNGEASVRLQEVPSNHSFYELEGSNNIILLTTERYNEYPLLIQGYGAGAGVTAGGVFSDIISIANIR